jgi:hypothetical protein
MEMQEYLKDHMTGEEKPDSFQDPLYDHLARIALEEFTSDTEERDEIELSVPVILRPVENDASVSVGFPSVRL